MEEGRQYLTLRLCIFEATDEERTLTLPLAKRFVHLFDKSAWHAEVCEVSEPATGATKSFRHYELKLVHRSLDGDYLPADRQATETAIETFCREFCDPNGALSPRKINPNQNIIFAVAADPNSPTDEIFLATFVKHNSQNPNGKLGLGPTNPTPSSSWPGELVTVGLSFVETLITLWSNQNGPEVGNDTEATLRLALAASQAVAQHLPEVIDASEAKHRTIVNEAVAGLDKAISSLRDLDPHARSSLELQVAEQCFTDLQNAMLVVSRKEGDAKQLRKTLATRRNLLAAMTAAIATLGLGFVMGNPNVVSASVPILSCGFSGFLAALQGMAAMTAEKDTKRVAKQAVAVHRQLFATALVVLRSDYRRHPEAPRIAKLAMDMAAFVDRDALAGWDYTAYSLELQSQYLESMREDSTRPAGQASTSGGRNGTLPSTD